jgi:anthranilate synthase component 1
MEGIHFGVHSKTLEVQIAPADLFSVFCENCENTFLLESSEGAEKLARFSFLGFLPTKTIRLKNGIIRKNGEEYGTEDPLLELKKEVGKEDTKTEGFLGGAVGYFSFEYVKYLEKLGSNVTDETGFPDFEFGIFDDAIVYDHRRSEIRYIYRGESRLEQIMGFIKDSSFETPPLKIGNAICNTTKEQFCKNVDLIKERISEGEIFQAVLSKRYEIEFSGSLLPFYKKLKATNPSPYMYYLKFGKRQIIGSSPENLVRVENRNISSYATLAGTRPRGKTPEEDALLEKDLLNDEKERAEHVMLVDLTRNDVGKVAEAGSVRVPELMNVHKYSHVQHIASLVTGKLRKDKDAYDTFNAIFPAGTVSGAPKVRALEIISELELAKRGPYAGAVGYFSVNGNADFAIGIRTLCADGDKAYVQAGAGIVYDSVPEKEYLETENKGKALLEALGVRGD